LQTSLLTDVALYDRGGIDRLSRDPEIHPLNLSDAEKADLVAFLKTLSRAPKPFVVPALPRSSDDDKARERVARDEKAAEHQKPSQGLKHLDMRGMAIRRIGDDCADHNAAQASNADHHVPAPEVLVERKFLFRQEGFSGDYFAAA
jgi:hypothetical protein